ncbi:MAG: host-nuclease inhibitor Gam family protein [Gammaproteobacteria bacterium]|nr:host-nuclease inhibitor Gam family protein [Gammaproteobacteria bacterium]
MARPKKPTLTLNTIDDCTAAMASLLVAETELEKLTATRDQDVAATSAMYEPAIDKFRARHSELTLALKTYYYAHLPECEQDGAKHLQLPNGVMGRRLNPPKLVPLSRNWTWAAILVRLRERFGSRFLRTRDPEIDRDLVKSELTEEQLHDVGLDLAQDETFYASPNRLPDPVEAAR